MGDITVRDFGVDKDTGKKVELYSLHGKDGKLVAEIMTYGATILSLYAPGPTDAAHDVIVSYDSLLPFFDPNPYYGATVGRVCNRICKGHFKLNGKEYQLAINNGPNHLHGGIKGFNKKVWDAKITGKKLVMSIESPDNDENYPGKLHMTATFEVKEGANGANCLSFTYAANLAEGEKLSTIINFTNHAYFNLAGNGENCTNSSSAHHTIANHRLAMRSTHYLPTTKDAIPTGEFRPCEKDKPMDFHHDYFSKCAETIPFGAATIPSIIKNYSDPAKFGRRFGDDVENKSCEQIVFGKGYDHSWMLQKGKGRDYTTAQNEPKDKKEELLLGAIATCDLGDTTRYLAVYTTQPSIQLYTGNWLGDDMGKKNDEKQPHLQNRKGPGYPERAGFALETQHYPDSINQPNFPSVVLKPGEKFEATTIFECGVVPK